MTSGGQKRTRSERVAALELPPAHWKRLLDSLQHRDVRLRMGLGVLAAVTYAVAVLRRVPPAQRRAMLMTTMFYNSGNYGLPLQDLAFRASGMGTAAQSLQVFVVIVQNRKVLIADY